MLSEATLCGHYVVLPLGGGYGHPDCPECLAAMTKAAESEVT